MEKDVKCDLENFKVIVSAELESIKITQEYVYECLDHLKQSLLELHVLVKRIESKLNAA